MKIRITIMLMMLLGSLSYGKQLEQLPNEGEIEFNEIMQNFRETPAPGRSIKIQDLVDVVGEESVKLSGFGVVSGLNGTGDGSAAAIELITRVAKKQGITINNQDLKSGNLAVVSVSAVVGPHQKLFDVAVKSISDAKSLQNGFLEGTTLSPIGSSEIYAIGTGAIALGARYFAAEGTAGAARGTSSVTIGHPTMGFVLDGGELIKEIPSERISKDTLTLFIKYPSNRTAANISNVINRYMYAIGVHAEPTNASTITVLLPEGYANKKGDITRLVADIGDLPTSVARKAVITIDQGSGVIAMTEGVKMEPGSIAISGLTVTVSSNITPVVRQGLFDGEIAFMDNPELEVAEDQANFLSLPAGTDLRQVQETLNALKLTPTSIISVFTAMHKAGMIHADIVVVPR